MKSKKLEYQFFHRACLEVAKDLVGKVLVHKTPEGILRLRISETEAYCGETDLWIEDNGFVCDIKTDKRVGIAYASQEDQDRPWRFIMVKE